MKSAEGALPERTSHAKFTHLTIVDQKTVARLASQLSCQSKECVMDTLGISSNTWTKMKRGEPVRRILVERAIERVSLPVRHRA